MTAIHRYRVPVNSAWHVHTLTGRVVGVRADGDDLMFWAEARSGYTERPRAFIVVGDGQTWPDGMDLEHCGMALWDPRMSAAWHLLEWRGYDGATGAERAAVGAP